MIWKLAMLYCFVFFPKFPATHLNQYEICPNIDECLYRLMTEKHLAVAVSRQQAMNNRFIAKSNLYCFDETESISTYFVAMYVNSTYFARDQMHVLTERFFESGLFQKWTMDSRIVAAKKETHQLQKLSIDHLLGAFFTYSLTFAWASLHLVLEIFSHKRVKQPNANRFWLLMDALHNGHRYQWTLGHSHNNIDSKHFTLHCFMCFVWF